MHYLISIVGLTSILFAAPLRAEVAQADNEMLKQLIAQGVPVIDVRTASEWQQTGVIEGSHLLTFFDESGNYDAEAWLAQLATIATDDQPLALICAVGGRTQAITTFLDQKLGYSKVHNVTAGIRAWISAGNETVKPPSQ